MSPCDPILGLGLVVLGLFLVVVETVLPTFGVAAILSLALVGYGTWSVWAAWGVAAGVLTLAGAVVLSLVLVALLFRSRWLVRHEQIVGHSSQVPSWTHLVGRHGVAVTDLRPSGIATIDGERHDVICQGRFLPRGSPVVVSRLEANSIVVEQVSARKEDGDA